MATQAPPTVQTCILVIEDSFADLVLMKEVIRSLSLEGSVYAAKTRSEAETFLSSPQLLQQFGSPSLIILDLHLGREHGADLIHRLRSNHLLKNPRIIAFTDHPDSTTEELRATTLVKSVPDTVFKDQFARILRDWQASDSKQ